jgi:SpoVK/Ycf46/Vps4 family AAA+-type ATPase
MVFDDDEWRKDEKLYRAIKDARFDSLVLAGSQKEEIRADARRFFAARDVYRRHGVPWKRGVLFFGPPGNGKTHAIKALINDLGVPCLYVRSFRGGCMSEEESMTAVFGQARKSAPCVLVFEDLDALITKRNRSYFLNELDGFAGNDGILTLATSNHPKRLDPAIVDRPSRFDRKYEFGLPGLPERLVFLGQWSRTLEPAMRLSPAGLRAAAEATSGFSYAYLKELCLTGLMRWIDRHEHDGEAPMDAIIQEAATLLAAQVSRPKRSRGKRKATVEPAEAGVRS